MSADRDRFRDTMTKPDVSWAAADDVTTVSHILRESAAWLRLRGIPLWDDDHLGPSQLLLDGARGRYCLARRGADAVGTARIQLADEELWPGAAPDEAIYLHRIAVRRAAAGTGVPEALLGFADEVARMHGASHLRLDCDASRTKLCELYSSLGFRHHSDLQLGTFHIRRFERAVS
jgi:GNAT superfamily N-acetyltransferase